ncbi:MAG: indole-3-glycerol phosphate synthase TrpC [Rothia sp. (in: high G+C Gram-positive bacteria)]|nr:indole-3-glycerol phosphate synthase TrpC [Rothia sp. (in: high G+C Gram-positive bacteria)]
MVTVLESIIHGVREDLQERKQQRPIKQLEEEVDQLAPALDTRAALASGGQEAVHIIAEVKRSSPSKGQLASIADPASLAKSYQQGGAALISVLTEQRRFKGSLADLQAVRQAVTIPVLRKDFMVDPYQIWEARAYGADLILLIAAALDDNQLKDLYDLTYSLGMQALVETHTVQEIERAAQLGAELIGVNVRNLKTLEVDRSHFASLAQHLPATALAVAESGVSCAADCADYARQGAKAVLVGEALVRSPDPQRTVRDFKVAGAQARQEYLNLL